MKQQCKQCKYSALCLPRGLGGVVLVLFRQALYHVGMPGFRGLVPGVGGDEVRARATRAYEIVRAQLLPFGCGERFNFKMMAEKRLSDGATDYIIRLVWRRPYD